MMFAWLCEISGPKMSRLSSLIVGIRLSEYGNPWSNPLMRSSKVVQPRKIPSMILNVERGRAPPLASFCALKLPIYGCNEHFLAIRHVTCYDCFHAARVWIHGGAELEKIVSIAIRDGCDSDIMHFGSPVKWFSGPVVVCSTYKSIVTAGRCVRGSIVLAYLITIPMSIFLSFFLVACVIEVACDRTLVPLGHFVVRFSF